MYQNLKLQMWRTGIKQNRLAQILGIHETQLSRIVNGFRLPDAELRARIARALDCDEEWIFTAEPPAASPPTAPFIPAD